jgi:hypothetical protein
MASPQMSSQIPDPREQQEQRRQFEKLQGGRGGRNSQSRRTKLAWWWGFWIVLFGVVGWWAVWGWGGTGGYWRTRVLGLPPAGAHVVAPAISGSGLAALNAANKQPFVGQGFQIHNVPVQSKVNSQVFWIGKDGSAPMLMVLRSPNVAKNGIISQGNLVDVVGIIKKAPPAAKAKTQWSLTSAGLTRLEQQGAYIQAKFAFWMPR